MHPRTRRSGYTPPSFVYSVREPRTEAREGNTQRWMGRQASRCNKARFAARANLRRRPQTAHSMHMPPESGRDRATTKKGRERHEPQRARYREGIVMKLARPPRRPTVEGTTWHSRPAGGEASLYGRAAPLLHYRLSFSYIHTHVLRVARSFFLILASARTTPAAAAAPQLISIPKASLFSLFFARELEAPSRIPAEREGGARACTLDVPRNRDSAKIRDSAGKGGTANEGPERGHGCETTIQRTRATKCEMR